MPARRLLPHDEYPVFFWADEVAWKTWLGFFSDESRVEVLPDVSAFVDVPAATEVWERDRAALFAAYPDLSHEPVTSNRRLVMVRVSRQQAASPPLTERGVAPCS